MSDDHVRLLRRVAKVWRQSTHDHRASDHASGSAGASRQADAERSSALAEARLVTAERKRQSDRTQAASGARAANVAELEAEAKHASNKVALQRRRSYLGKGDPRKLAELERIAAGAAGRVREARRKLARSSSS